MNSTLKPSAWAARTAVEMSKAQAALALYQAVTHPSSYARIERVVETNRYTLFEIYVGEGRHINLVKALKLVSRGQGNWSWHRRLKDPIAHTLELTAVPARDKEATPTRFNLIMKTL